MAERAVTFTSVGVVVEPRMKLTAAAFAWESATMTTYLVVLSLFSSGEMLAAGSGGAAGAGGAGAVIAGAGMATAGQVLLLLLLLVRASREQTERLSTGRDIIHLNRTFASW